MVEVIKGCWKSLLGMSLGGIGLQIRGCLLQHRLVAISVVSRPEWKSSFSVP